MNWLLEGKESRLSRNPITDEASIFFGTEFHVLEDKATKKLDNFCSTAKCNLVEIGLGQWLLSIKLDF